MLNDERDRLYTNIDKRVDIMVQEGLLEEVMKLLSMGCKRESTAMQGIGYKEILDYLDDKCSFEDAVNAIKSNTRHFAKRQLTWFRRERDVIWVDKDKFAYNDQMMLEYIVGCCKDIL